jgi:transketolase
MRNEFARTLKLVADEIPGIYLIAADISPASAPDFQEAYPERFFNVGVAEQAMIGTCAGLALKGMRPYAYTIATFSAYRPFEQIRVDLCYQNLPVTIVGMGAGIVYSKLGGTHHTQEDVAVMSALPNMTVLAPCDPLEVAHSVWATARCDGPVYLRTGKAGEPNLTENAPDEFVFGKIRKIKEGKDACIFTYGPIAKKAFELADRIKKEKGEDVAIYSCHTLKPLDKEGIVNAMNSYPKALVIEEHSVQGGLAAQVKALAFDSNVKTKLLTYSLKDEFIHFYGSYDELLKMYGIDPEQIFKDYCSL